MKYIVDLPEAYTSKSALFGDILSIPICLESGKRYGIPTGIKLEPYTEPNEDNAMWMDGYKKGVEAGRDDAWELAGDIAYRIMSYGDCLDANMLDKNENYSSPNGVLDKLTYQEAKDKYDAWKKQREEINIGDEISCPGKLYVEAVVIGMDDDDDLYIIWKQSGKIDMIESSQRKHWVKTGICFPEVEELLKKMRGE